MASNIGFNDRILRLIAGLALLGLLLIVDGNIRWLGLLGLIALVTTAFGYCPIYGILGINTCEKKK